MSKLAFSRHIEDDNLTADIALPAAASSTVVTAGVDTQANANGVQTENYELALKVPALSATILPDTRTATLTIEASDSATFASGVQTLGTKVMTGAGGVGAAAADLRAHPAADMPRYVRGKVAFGASTTDGSALSAHFALKF